jgi:hypothetical protein
VRTLYIVLSGTGLSLGAASLVWTWRERRTRSLWHESHHIETVAMVLELEEHLRALEHTPGTDTR